MLHTELDLLIPSLASRAEDALKEMRTDPDLMAAGVKPVVIETHRDLATQMAYYSRGRMAPPDAIALYCAAGLWKISEAEAARQITWTLDSKHLRGEAIDIAPMRKGQVWWLAPEEIWERMGQIGESHGMTWGGRWAAPKTDKPHYEL
jgi:hypothetical protein